VPTNNPQNYATINTVATNTPQNNTQIPAYASGLPPQNQNRQENIPSYASGLPPQNQNQQPENLPTYASGLPPQNQTNFAPNQSYNYPTSPQNSSPASYNAYNSNKTQNPNQNQQFSNAPASYQSKPANTDGQNQTPSAYASLAAVPSAYGSPVSNNSPSYSPAYASSIVPPASPNTNTAPSTPIYASFQAKPTENAPSSYGAGFKPTVQENKDSYSSSLKDLYQSLGVQTSYLTLPPRPPVSVAAESLRLSSGTEVQAKTNDDGSTEGWLWQQNDSGHWDRLYFILDENQLLAFKHFPQKAEEAVPIQGLELKTGMLVTSQFSSYLGVRGFCFSIQIRPNSSNVVIFDTVTAADRSVWVSAFEKATKADEISAWVPWEMESRTATLAKEQEIRQLQQLEKQRIEQEKEKEIQKRIEEVKQQEIAKVTDSVLADQLVKSYNNQKEIEYLEKHAQRLREETNELNNYKNQLEESLDRETALVQSQDIILSMSEREMKLQLLEEEKKKKNGKCNGFLCGRTKSLKTRTSRDNQTRRTKNTC